MMKREGEINHKESLKKKYIIIKKGFKMKKRKN
jgi:hypothetical protein